MMYDTTQHPLFIEVQALYRKNKTDEWFSFMNAVLMQALECGRAGVTAEEVLSKVGRNNFSKNLPGAVFGSLRANKTLTVISREKSRHSDAKGRWVCRFALTRLLSQWVNE